MPYAPLSDDDGAWAILAGWGRGLRRARYAVSMTQGMLERRSDVDQSAISRFERGLAPRTPAERLARLGLVLGKQFPLGSCPHDHDCMWREPSAPPGPRPSREAFYEWRRTANAHPPYVLDRDETLPAVGSLGRLW